MLVNMDGILSDPDPKAMNVGAVKVACEVLVRINAEPPVSVAGLENEAQI